MTDFALKQEQEARVTFSVDPKGVTIERRLLKAWIQGKMAEWNQSEAQVIGVVRAILADVNPEPVEGGQKGVRQ